MIKPIITKEAIEEWFLSRGLQPLKYQIDSILQINDVLFDKDKAKKKVLPVLGASPTAGKTLMIICFLYFYIKANPKAKVLISAHGTTVLREQFLNDIKKHPINFTYSEITAKEKHFTSQVTVAIPQTISNIEKLPHFDLMITDEAHHFYLAKGSGKNKGKDGQVMDILKKTKPKHQILLTGTPAKFVYANKFEQGNYELILVSLNEVLETNRASDPYIEMASTTAYQVTFEDFNNEGELQEKSDTKLDRISTNEVLDNWLLPLIIHRVQSRYKNPKTYQKLDTPILGKYLLSIIDTFSILKKTMIACRSNEQARYVYENLTNQGVKALLSTAKFDPQSEELKNFYERVKDSNGVDTEKFKYPEYVVLIVIDRGILGFNLPELENVVDMTLSYNPTQIYQLMCRVARKHPRNKDKLFFKVIPHDMVNFYNAIMQITLSLTDKDYLREYDGRLWEKRIRVKQPKRKPCYVCGKTATHRGFGGLICNKMECHEEDKRKTQNGKPGRAKTAQPPRPPLLNPPSFEGIQGVKFFNDLEHQDQSILNGYAYITLRELKNRIRISQQNKSDTIEEAVKFLNEKFQ